MRQLITLFLIFGLNHLALGQQNSVGISVSAFEQYGGSVFFNAGSAFSADYQFSFSEKLGLRTALVYGDYNNVKPIGEITNIPVTPNSNGTFPDPNNVQGTGELSKHFLIMRSSFVLRILHTKWINAEILIGPGLFRSEGRVNGTVHNELFLSKNISNKFVLGLPIRYNHIFGSPPAVASIGLSMRYYL